MAEFGVVKESFLQRFLTLEHESQNLNHTISICYVACLSQKYGHVFLGQDTGNPPTHGFEPDQKGKNKRLKSREV